MANEKDLSLLTIDGSTYRTVLTNPNIGKMTYTQFNGSGQVPVTTPTDIGNMSITVPEDGLYYIFCGVRGMGNTTNSIYRQVALSVNGVLDYAQPYLLPDNVDAWTTWQTVRELKKDDILRYQMFTFLIYNYTQAGINIFRLPKYPDVVGGVIRTLKSLKNSICYRPLNFGKAVA